MMSWVLSVLGIVLLLVIAPFVIDSVWARLSRYTQAEVGVWRVKHPKPGVCSHDDDDWTQEHRKGYLVVPGILARWNQVVPLMHALGDYDVFALTYDGLRYSREAVVEQGVAMLRWMLKRYDVVVLDGISHGGTAAAYIVEALDESEQVRVDVIVHDPPDGVWTIKQVPNWAAGLFRFTAGRAANIVFFWVPLLFAKMGGPRQENVVTPNDENMVELAGKLLTDDEYFAAVEGQAEGDLSGHNFSMWYSEIGDMVATGREGVPFAALRKVKSFTYIAYVGELNDTIVQPNALRTFLRNVPGANFVKVAGAHCGFWNNNDANIAALKEALPK